MIIVCDLDRTLLPNGSEPDDGALARFYELLDDSDHILVYATGRHLGLVERAYRDFGLQVPDYLLASVGTMVYEQRRGILALDPEWKEYVYNLHPQWERREIAAKLGALNGLTFQEDEVQNEFKISLYADITKPGKEVQKEVRKALQNLEGVEVIYSVDPHKQIGLVDVLPASATKLGAIEYLRQKLGTSKEDVIYAGDSGNDILPLTYGYKAILVNNAPSDVREEVLHLAKEKGIEDNIYLATGTNTESGNYASGVIEGLKHFLIQRDSNN